MLGHVGVWLIQLKIDFGLEVRFGKFTLGYFKLCPNGFGLGSHFLRRASCISESYTFCSQCRLVAVD